MESAVLQICLSAAMTLVALPVMVKGTLGWLLPRQAVQWVARLAPRLACGAIMVLSLSQSGRAAAQLRRSPASVPAASSGRPATRQGCGYIYSVSHGQVCVYQQNSILSTTASLWISRQHPSGVASQALHTHCADC